MAVKFVEFIPRVEASIDGAWRVESYKASAHPLQVNRYPYKLHFYPHNAFAIFGDKQEAFKIIHRFNPHRRGTMFKSVRMMVFEYDKETIKELAGSTSGSTFKVLSGATFSDGLASLEEYFSKLKELCKIHEILRPMNKKYDVIPLFIKSGELFPEEIQKRFIELLKSANKLRVQLVFIAENPRLIPQAIEELISWELFLGNINSEFAEDAYELETVHKNHNKLQAGVILDKENTPGYLLYAYDYRAENTDYLNELILAEKKEKDNYLEFLSNLVSGDEE